MREILFKALTNEGKWVYWDKFGRIQEQIQLGKFLYLKNVHVIADIIDDGNIICEETVCQYTNLKDKNGKKVFSNDLVKDEKGDIFAIKLVEGGFIAVCKGDYNKNSIPSLSKKYYSLTEYQNQHWITQSCEIIGNIHDKEDK